MKIPKGFKATGVHSGIKRQGLDLALICSEVPCIAFGAFTRNKIKAAPVLYSRRVIREGKARAIVANSGCANACTGREGLATAKKMAELTAQLLGISPKEVLVASTGVIGEKLPIEKVEQALPKAVKELSADGFIKAAEAIMTTDTVPKLCWNTVKVGGEEGVILGIAKGAGMINPYLATMLCFIFTDLELPPKELEQIFWEALALSFNAITVDGEQSTNDTVFLLANGLKGTPLTSRQDLQKFKKALIEVMRDLSFQIVKDAEGATMVVKIRVKGAKSLQEANQVARRVANSLLVKTALFGRDPNWGRVMAAIGDSGVPIREERVCLKINGIPVFEKGSGLSHKEEVRKALKESKEAYLEIDIGRGNHEFEILTCDLSYDYVKINSQYTT